MLPGGTRDDEELTLRVPNDGESRSLLALLSRLDENNVNAQEFSVRTPDLDDVFLALTDNSAGDATAGNPTREKEAVAP